MKRAVFFGCIVLVGVAAVALAWPVNKPNAPAQQNLNSHEWLGWRGPDQQNHSLVEGLQTNWSESAPKLDWTAEGCGAGYASISLAEGHLYTTGNFADGQGVVAFNAADGSQLWKTTLTEKVPKHGYQGSRCTPAVDGNRLYVVTSDGQIVCLNRADGVEVWSKDFRQEWNGKMMSGWGYSESPLVDGDWVLCTPGGNDAMIVALEKTSGREVWRSAVPDLGEHGKAGAGYSSIVISHAAGVKQYVQLIGRGVIGVRASDGKFLWGYNRVANGTANIPTPIVSGDYVFAATGYGAGSCLLKLSAAGDRVEAEEVYFLPGNKLQNHHGGMVKVGDYIYLGNAHNQGFPTCVEMMTGEIAWGGKLRGPGKGSAAITYCDGHVIFRYQSGEVACIEATPKDYNLKGVFTPEFVKSPSWAHPVVVAGKLFLREQDKLMCYSVTK